MNLASTAARFSRSTPWEQVGELVLDFDAAHPQGMVRIDGVWWISTVDIDTTSGWVLAVDTAGRLVDRTPVGDDVRFHPGGMDFDGEALWVASAEYRPRSTAVVERLVPGGRPEPAFAVDDHVGAIVRLGAAGDLVGWTWGSRRFRRWTVEGTQLDEARNPGHFVDHQDGQWLGDDLLLCGGVAGSLGGIGLLRATDLTMVCEAPFPHRSARTGRPATQNPIFAEAVDDTMVVHLLPDDGVGAILSYATPLR
ncbi:MAG: DUF6454 family protein [Actinomycetota bacterium]|nr:DUF6454 family protein [Actinomycetota bacterium]